MPKQADERYSHEEVQQRFDAALRGSRITGHKSMAEVRGKAKSKIAASSRGKKKPTTK
jgi:hypothetical protein